MAKYCRYCGVENNDDAEVCVQCGKSFEKKSSERKMGLSKIFKEGFNFIKKSPKLLILSVSLFLAIQIIILAINRWMIGFSYNYFNPESIDMIDPGGIIVRFISILLLAIPVGIAYVVVDAIIIFSTQDYMKSESVSLSSAWQNTRKRISSLILFSLFIAVFSLAVTFIPIMISFGLMMLSFALGAVFMIIAFIAISVVLILTLAFPYQAFLLHNCGYVESLKQSWRIARHNLGDYIILSLAFAALSFLLGLVLLPFTLASVSPNSAPSIIINLTLEPLRSGFIGLYTTIGITMFYITRARSEE